MADARHLRLICGPWVVLVAAGAVREVIELEHGAEAGEGAGRRRWRGHSVPVLCLRAWLGTEPAASAAPQIDVVVEAGGVEAALRVDDVAGLIQAEPEDIQALPALPKAAAQRFDAALFDSERGAHLLRIRMSAAVDAAGRLSDGGSEG